MTINLAGESIRDFIETLNFGEYIRLIRESDKITQRELAKRVGCKPQYINAIEHGREKSSIEFANRIADALGYSVAPFAEILMQEQLKSLDPLLQIQITRRAHL
jgi:transcriptional regulator with XRE-family HTH domain